MVWMEDNICIYRYGEILHTSAVLVGTIHVIQGIYINWREPAFSSVVCKQKVCLTTKRRMAKEMQVVGGPNSVRLASRCLNCDLFTTTSISWYFYRKDFGVRPHKEKINISKEIINKTRGAVAPYAAQIFTHLSVVSSRQRSYDRLRCEEVTLGRGKG